MSTAQKKDEPKVRATKVWFEADFICLQLTDGREVKTPLSFYPRLMNATESQRLKFELSNGGYGIHWEEIDEDLSTEGIALGKKAIF